MNIRKHIPNFITTLNLFCGCLGTSIAYNGNLELASLMIALAGIFDFFDGLSARLLHVKSETGKQLDSLADVVSFGLLPGVIIFQLMRSANNLPGVGTFAVNPFPYLAFLIPIFSALRLAKFNIDIRQSDSFLGVPTPASALFFGSLPLIVSRSPLTENFESVKAWLGNYYLLAFLTLVMCALLISELPLFSLKFKNLRWADNKAQYILLLFGILSACILGFIAIPLIIVAYIFLSLVYRHP